MKTNREINWEKGDYTQTSVTYKDTWKSLGTSSYIRFKKIICGNKFIVFWWQMLGSQQHPTQNLNPSEVLLLRLITYLHDLNKYFPFLWHLAFGVPAEFHQMSNILIAHVPRLATYFNSVSGTSHTTSDPSPWPTAARPSVLPLPLMNYCWLIMVSGE